MAQKPFEGQVALVTGAAKRVGRSIALKLAEEGADVVVHYGSSKKEAEAVAAEIAARGRRALAWKADVSKREGVREMFAAVEREFNRLDILVNNAGAFFRAKFEELTDEQWDRIMGANLKAHFLTCQAAAPLMKRQKKAHIINITSIGGLLPWPEFTHYCVSKAGAIMLTRCLARALAPEIRVNSVAPGTIQFDGEALDQAYVRRAPLGKTGRGEDIADTVAFLAQSDFITGQVIAVDGGRTLT
jgi:NAD(P)-dependent dehydrogenase (short-subunit alcohol dehydrogenase family)